MMMIHSLYIKGVEIMVIEIKWMGKRWKKEVIKTNGKKIVIPLFSFHRLFCLGNFEIDIRLFRYLWVHIYKEVV